LVIAHAVALLLGVSTLGTGGASAVINHFDAGYCTWQAAEDAHAAWGIWVPWYGDAGDWIQSASASGWHVSSVPQVDSIMALPRGVQGSGALGHVAWVLAIDQDGMSVLVRSMDWQGRGLITVHTLAADGIAQFLTPPDDTAAGP
jgi:surface antigen